MGWDAVKDDAAMLTKLAAHKSLFKAARCFYVAEAYLALNKVQEALALFARALERAQESERLFAALPKGTEPDQACVATLGGLLRETQARQLVTRATCIINQHDADTPPPGLDGGGSRTRVPAPRQLRARVGRRRRRQPIPSTS